MRRALAAVIAATSLLAGSCATDGTGAAAPYDGFLYDDPWWYYGGAGWWVDYPGDIGPPPHPEHPIARPDPPRPAHPIAEPPKAATTPSRPSATPMRSMPSARPAMRGGGGRR